MKKYSLVLFALSFLGMWHGTATAACWELTDKDGGKILVSDIWHVRSRLTKVSALMGKLDGEDTSILVDDINTITLEPAKQGVMSFMGGDSMSGNISFTNGSTGKFESDQSLFYLKDGEKHSMPLSDLRSMARCDEDTARMMADSTGETTAAPVPAKQPPESDVDRVILRNGDILSGTITTTDFHWKAPYASLSFKRDQIRAITLSRDSGESGIIELYSGDRISGVLENTSVEMTLEYGQRVPLATGMLESIRFRAIKP